MLKEGEKVGRRAAAHAGKIPGLQVEIRPGMLRRADLTSQLG